MELTLFKLGQIEATFDFDFSPDILNLVVLVLALSLIVGVYSYYYVKEHKARYFFWLTIFCFSMIGFLLMDNLLLAYAFWEGLGLSSFFLVRFYNTDDAVKKSNLVLIFNKVADIGFLLLIAQSFINYKTVSIRELLSFQTNSLAPAIILCAFGKSAQVFFFPWLKFAMAGPTPVSSLLHSATMVGAGAILIWKFNQMIPSWINYLAGLTGILAAYSAIISKDAKEMLAYSTISNLSLLVISAVSFPDVFISMFFAHAFFKCAAFLYIGHLSTKSHSTLFDDLRKVSQSNLEKIALIALSLSLAGVGSFGVGTYKAQLNVDLYMVDAITILTYIYGYSFWRRLVNSSSSENTFKITNIIVFLLTLTSLIYSLSSTKFELNMVKSIVLFSVSVIFYELLFKMFRRNISELFENLILNSAQFIVKIFSSLSKGTANALEIIVASFQDTAKLTGFAFSKYSYSSFQSLFIISVLILITFLYLSQ